MKHLSIFIIIAFFISCSKKVEESKALAEPITESVYASGFVKSKNQYQVFSTVNGLVTEIFKQEGDLVKKGDAILQLSNEAPKLSAENAALASYLASQNVKGDKIKELQTAIDFAKSKLKLDSMMFARQKNLWASQIGSQAELEQKELTYKNSLSLYQTAIYRYNDAKKSLEVSAEQAQNQSRISSKLENDFMVRSETDGRIYSILKEKGELVNSLSPLAVIGDAASFMIELQVDEYDITKIKVGQVIYMSLDSYKGEVFEGTVTKVNQIMNERSRSFKVDANFTKAPAQLYPNLSLEANIVIQTKAKAITIPRNYLINDSMVLNKNKEQIIVRTGLKDFKKIEILSGLNEGDVILKPGK